MNISYGKSNVTGRDIERDIICKCVIKALIIWWCRSYRLASKLLVTQGSPMSPCPTTLVGLVCHRLCCLTVVAFYLKEVAHPPIISVFLNEYWTIASAVLCGPVHVCCAQLAMGRPTIERDSGLVNSDVVLSTRERTGKASVDGIDEKRIMNTHPATPVLVSEAVAVSDGNGDATEVVYSPFHAAHFGCRWRRRDSYCWREDWDANMRSMTECRKRVQEFIVGRAGH
ncbi:hypothetical protein V8B97DRAFT_320646 [Scleroderma yunnanense]